MGRHEQNLKDLFLYIVCVVMNVDIAVHMKCLGYLYLAIQHH